MLQYATLQFLKDLKKNNHRDWFENNRKTYETAKKDFENFTDAVLEQLSKKDNSIKHLQPKDCLFRINRDVRFSKDKSPYKTNFGMFMAKGGKKSNGAGYYFHLEPGQAFTGGGLWMPLAPELKKVRQEIDYCSEEFLKMVHAKKFKTTYTDLSKEENMQLSRPPKGYEENHPAIQYIKLKSFVATAPVADAMLQSKDLIKNIVSTLEVLSPLVHFINRAIEQ